MGKLMQAPIQRFLRNPNAKRDMLNPVSFKKTTFQNTFTHLKDPKNNRELVLIGTLNSSDLLAKRTENFLKEYNPDQILVQANQGWFDNINRQVKNVQTNYDIFNATRNSTFEQFKATQNIRGWLHRIRFYSWKLYMKQLIPLNSETCHPLLPGLEVYKTIEYAQQNSKNINFAERAFDSPILKAMKVETRQSFLHAFLRNTIFNNQVAYYKNEYDAFFNLLLTNNFEDIVESIDDVQIQNIIAIIERAIPHQKRIMIDNLNERLIKQIYEMQGKRLFALVNHWNKPGLEYLWKNITETEEKKESINPIGDMDINKMQEIDQINEYLRRRNSKNSKSEPMVTCNYITQYHKMTTEPERERHVFFDGWKDPHLEHGLYNDENKDVKDLPYKLEHHQLFQKNQCFYFNLFFEIIQSSYQQRF